MQLKTELKMAFWTKKAPQYYNQNYANSLTVFNSKIYAGTYESGLLFEWNGEDAWTLKASPIGTPPNDECEICSLVVFNGKLYGGTKPHGKLVEWNGTNAWVEKAPQLGDETIIYSLAVFNGKLYGSTYPHGKLYEWNGIDAWVEKAPQLESEQTANSLIVFNDKLYASTYPHGKLVEWNGIDAWAEKAPQPGSESLIWSMVEFEEKLYGGGYGTGKLFEWNGTDAWVEKAPRIGNAMIRSLVVFRNKLLAGTYNYNPYNDGGKLFEWNGTDAWIERAQPLHEEFEILSLVVLEDNLYAGTAPNGMLYQLEWVKPETAKTRADEKIYIIPPGVEFDRSLLDTYSVDWKDFKYKSVQREGNLPQRDLEVTLDRNVPMQRYSTVLLTVEGIPKFRGFVEQIVTTRDKKRIACKGSEARLSYRYASKVTYADSWYHSAPYVGAVLSDSVPYSQFFSDGPGLLFCANSYLPPGTPYTIYDSAKNIAVIRNSSTPFNFSDRYIFVRMDRDLKQLTQWSALSDLQDNDLGYYIDTNGDIYVRVENSNWYAVGGLFVENIVDTGVRLGTVAKKYHAVDIRLYLDGEEIAELLSNFARSEGLSIAVRDTFEYTYLNFGASGRGEGQGVLTIYEKDLLDFEKSTSSNPQLQAMIGRGDANQHHTAYDQNIKSGLLGHETFESAYARSNGRLTSLTAAALSSNNTAYVWKLKVPSNKVKQLNSGDYLRIKLLGEGANILPITKYVFSPGQASLQLGGRIPGFSDAWEALNSLPQFGEHLIKIYPEQNVSLTMKPQDLDHATCPAGSAVMNVPAAAKVGPTLILLNLSASLNHPLAATNDVWRFIVMINGQFGNWGIVDEVPLEKSISIDVTDLVAVGDNTIYVYARYYSKIEADHDTCNSGYQIPMAPWIPDSYYVGHPDLKVDLTMNFFGMI